MDLGGIDVMLGSNIARQWWQVAGYAVATILATSGLVGSMLLLFRNRWTLSWRG
jgi:hypothetical protein